MSAEGQAGRRFTDAERAAAVEAQRRKRDEAEPPGTPEVFVVRLSGAHFPFGWEIRRFGALVLDRGQTGFATVDEARTAGTIAFIHPENNP